MSATNNLRKVLGNSKNVIGATRNASAVATAAANNELTNKWLNRLRATANNAESREDHSKLQAILDFYNKQSHGTANLSKIDWDKYESSIHTKDVVNKIKGKYDNFMEAEFQVDGAVSKCGTRSEAMKSLDTAMHYNHALWSAHYEMHLEQLETMANIGDVTELSMMEMTELFPEAEAFNSMNQEIGNISPQDAVENPAVVRLATQFSWGSRYSPPFVHSNDSISSIVATLQKLGK